MLDVHNFVVCCHFISICITSEEDKEKKMSLTTGNDSQGHVIFGMFVKENICYTEH